MQFTDGQLNLPHDFTYFILSVLASGLTFSTVKLHIRLSYYFFVLTKNSAALLNTKTTTVENKKYKTLLYLMYYNVLSPLIVSVLFIKPLVEVLLVPDYLSESTWRILRIAVVVISICLRMMTFREELQFYFNESYFLVQRLMQDKNEKIFRYIKLRITENFFNTWYAIFQHICNLVIPMLLLLCYVHRLVSYVSVSENFNYNLDFTKVQNRLAELERESLLQGGKKGKINIFDDS